MVKGWHFVGSTLVNGDPVPDDNIWLVPSEPIIGVQGYKTIYDALKHASKPILCLCEFKDIIKEKNNSFIAKGRRILERVDLTEQLFKYARQQALTATPAWNPPNIVLHYLRTGENKKEAATWSSSNEESCILAQKAAKATSYTKTNEELLKAIRWIAGCDAAWAATWDNPCAAAICASREAAVALGSRINKEEINNIWKKN